MAEIVPFRPYDPTTGVKPTEYLAQFPCPFLTTYDLLSTVRAGGESLEALQSHLNTFKLGASEMLDLVDVVAGTSEVNQANVGDVIDLLNQRHVFGGKLLPHLRPHHLVAEGPFETYTLRSNSAEVANRWAIKSAEHAQNHPDEPLGWLLEALGIAFDRKHTPTPDSWQNDRAGVMAHIHAVRSVQGAAFAEIVNQLCVRLDRLAGDSQALNREAGVARVMVSTTQTKGIDVLPQAGFWEYLPTNTTSTDPSQGRVEVSVPKLGQDHPELRFVVPYEAGHGQPRQDAIILVHQVIAQVLADYLGSGAFSQIIEEYGPVLAETTFRGDTTSLLLEVMQTQLASSIGFPLAHVSTDFSLIEHLQAVKDFDLPQVLARNLPFAAIGTALVHRGAQFPTNFIEKSSEGELQVNSPLVAGLAAARDADNAIRRPAYGEHGLCPASLHGLPGMEPHETPITKLNVSIVGLAQALLR